MRVVEPYMYMYTCRSSVFVCSEEVHFHMVIDCMRVSCLVFKGLVECN